MITNHSSTNVHKPNPIVFSLMETHHLQLLLLTSTLSPFSNSKILLNPPPVSTTVTRCGSTRYGGGGGSRWTEKSGRFNIDESDFFDDGDGSGGDKFDFGGSGGKQRIWWSEKSFDFDEYEEDEEDDEEFGAFQDAIGIGWVLKVFRAFGWMLPAIVISMVVGTGPNAILMALALPLAQSALSLVIDTISGRSSNNARPKPRTRKRPFASAASNIGVNKRKEQTSRPDEARVNCHSGAAANDNPVNRSARNRAKFGGWDELDKQDTSEKSSKTSSTQTQKVNSSREVKKGKLSRRVRNRDTPLLLRLLIAIFPFLGNWTKFL